MVLIAHGKGPTIAIAALARELVGFLWAAMTRAPLHAGAVAEGATS